MKDISLMTKEEFDRYGLNRMKIMLKMKKQSEVCLQKRPTPLQDIILQTAEIICDRILCMGKHYWLTAMQTWRGTGNSGIRASLQVVQTNPAHENCNKRQENPWLSEVTGRIIMIQRCEPALNMCGGRTIFCMIFDPKISELKATKEPSEHYWIEKDSIISSVCLKIALEFIRVKSFL